MKAPKRKFNRSKYNKAINELAALPTPAPKLDPKEGDLSFEAHDDATSQGCKMCGDEYSSLNVEGYCSRCWVIWTH